MPLSVDTFCAEVAQQAVHAGAHMVNDISGGSLDPHMHQQVCVSRPAVKYNSAAPLCEWMTDMLQWYQDTSSSP